MSANRPRIFKRKPVNQIQEVHNEKYESSLQMANRNKTLGFTTKICQVNIYPSPTKQSIDQSLAYSISLTPITSTQKKKIENQRMVQVRKHLYGTQDNFIQDVEKENEQSLLLDYKQILDGEKRHKIPVTPITNCSNSSAKVLNQQQQAKQSKICSNFKMFSPQYKLSFYYLNKNTIKVHYLPFKQENTEKRQSFGLVLRMRKLFYRQPLLLFDFIATTLQKWDEFVLKIFLITNSIKFNTAEIKDLQYYMEEMSSSLNMHQIAQTLFLVSNQQHQMLINSQKTKMSKLLLPQQSSFLKLSLAMINQNTTDNLSQLLPSIQTFFRKII